METELVGSIKIKDGLFLGDQYAAQDLEFIVGNKVTYIINCAGNQVPNHWVPIGVKYMTYRWEDNNTQIILDSSQKAITRIANIIETTNSRGESVLVHSVHGKNRAVCVLSAFLMKTLQWALSKSTDFLKLKQPDYRLREVLARQLSKFEKLLSSETPLSNGWTVARTLEEAVLNNTFLNSKVQEGANVFPSAKTKKNIRWATGLTNCPGTVIAQLRSCLKKTGHFTENTNILQEENSKEEDNETKLKLKTMSEHIESTEDSRSANELDMRRSSATVSANLVEKANMLKLKHKEKKRATAKKMSSLLAKKLIGKQLSWK